jgi:dTDP-4-amino-4,6-dideoxygalactose transaminase
MAAMDSPPVPFVDLRRAQSRIAGELDAAFQRTASSAMYTLGPDVAEFENEFAAYCGTRHCIGTSDGTEALRIALMALGAGPGREVIAPAMTYFATVEAIVATGAKPVLVDVDDARTISVEALRPAISADTAAVVPVHLYGRPAAMAEIRPITDAAAVPVLEDACQAHGARSAGRRTGDLGAAAAFSFYPSKNLGALGDAGAVTTSDDEVAEAVRALRMHGTAPGNPNDHRLPGGATGRIDTLQAAFLRAKLPHLDTWNAERRAAADLYRDALAGLPVELPPADPDDGDQVFHLFVVVVDDDRDRVLAELRAAGIGAAVHYPVAPHLQPAARGLGYARGDFPRAERLASGGISLPIFPGIREDEIARVAVALRDALST